MLIVDVIRRLNTTHEILFLLSAYVETLQFYDAANTLPAGVAGLPLRGLKDVEKRYTDLLDMQWCELARSQCNTHNAILREALAVFGEGRHRLQSLTPPHGLTRPGCSTVSLAASSH